MYRVAAVDPQVSIRAALRVLIWRMESIRVDEACEDYDSFEQVVLRKDSLYLLSLDVAIVVLEQNYLWVLQLIAELAAKFPGLRILAEMPRADPTLFVEFLRRGGSAYAPF